MNDAPAMIFSEWHEAEVESCFEMIKKVTPIAAEAFEEHALRGQTFSRSEMEVLRSMLDGGDNSLKGKALQRFEAKLQLPREE